jgi:isopentenyldiphosphate isomerase
MSVYKLATALDKVQTKIFELERTMNTEREEITVEFEYIANTIENMHKEEIDKVLRTQKYKMEVEFEKKVYLIENMNKEELDALR